MIEYAALSKGRGTIRRAEQDEELVEKKRHGRKHRRADEDEMIEKKKRHGRKHRRADEDEMIESEKFFKALGSLGKSGWLTFKHCITIDERC